MTSQSHITASTTEHLAPGPSIRTQWSFSYRHISIARSPTNERRTTRASDKGCHVTS